MEATQQLEVVTVRLEMVASRALVAVVRAWLEAARRRLEALVVWAWLEEVVVRAWPEVRSPQRAMARAVVRAMAQAVAAAEAETAMRMVVAGRRRQHCWVGEAAAIVLAMAIAGAAVIAVSMAVALAMAIFRVAAIVEATAIAVAAAIVEAVGESLAQGICPPRCQTSSERPNSLLSVTRRRPPARCIDFGSAGAAEKRCSMPLARFRCCFGPPEAAPSATRTRSADDPYRRRAS